MRKKFTESNFWMFLASWINCDQRKLLLTHTFKIHPIFLLKVSLNSVSEYKHSIAEK